MDQKIPKIIESLEAGMINFMEEGETSYTQTDVEKCIKLITDYVDAVKKSTSREEGMNAVKTVVLSLNQLNENYDYELIETDQREEICEIIILAGNSKGYNELTDDITEEWREW